MKKILKKLAKKTFGYSKKVAHSNPITKRAARSVKRTLRHIVEDRSQREVYNFLSFYPTIKDYYTQTHERLDEDSPLISILLPTYNTPELYLRECIESIILQSYANWELCIADDNSSNKMVVAIINEYQKKDKRIKLIVREKNGHISQATNSALEMATGEYVGLMDHDDILWPNALYEFVKVIRANREVDFIYSDEDKIDGTGSIHSYPFLKPDFSPEFLESCNYITHFSCMKTSIIKKVGGFRKGYEGAQDWDLFIRISEVTNNIIHIPKILYSWRIHELSTASDTDAKPYVYEAQRKLLVDHANRLGKEGVVETGIIQQHRTIKYKPQGSLTVLIDFTAIDKTKALLTSFNKHPAGIVYDTVVMSREPIADTDKNHLRSMVTGACRFIAIRDLRHVEKYVKTTSLLFAKDDVVVASDSWGRIAIADSEVDNVAFVSPVLLDKTGSKIESAGIGIGYGPLGYTDMLKGMPFDDPHYTRGLYAKSRRNVSAIDGNFFAIKTNLFFEKIRQLDHFDSIDTSLSFLNDGKRHIYTPYLQVVSYSQKQNEIVRHFDIEDKYLNPHFKTENGFMEVKA